MGRRIRWLGLVMIACFTLVLLQVANVQFRRASALANSPDNPRNQLQKFDNARGFILASDGTVLAQSVKTPAGPYHYQRVYPQADLYSQVVGFSSIFYGTSGLEYEYNHSLVRHAQPAQNLAQGLGLEAKPSSTDDVTLTIVPALQKTAQQALANVPGALKDGAVVALDPHTGAVLAMYSNPTYDPNKLSSPNIPTEQFWDAAYQVKDADGFRPIRAMATREFFQPGSTSKVLTTAGVYDLKPALSGYSAPYQACTPLPDSNKTLCNSGGSACGGTISVMLPPSCDPGYADLGLQLGGDLLAQQGANFGYNTVPPIDLPGVIAGQFPTAHDLSRSGRFGLPGVAYAAIGQQSVYATALQNALIASAIANGGVIMTPHLMAQIRDSSGNVVTTYTPSAWRTATTKAAASQIIPLMQAVATRGTASGVGFPAALNVAVKTGTAQTGNVRQNTDDWMIGFAPANNPVIAVAVVVPNQPVFTDGAEIAGPIMKAMLTAALALKSATGPGTGTPPGHP